ncbi:hypothetical protein CBR_g25866 [Chara braunii]|uniref:Reverse transcriptase domain-containing protein n=1 Tax=Chara braunii TaxID=69332 RepID=A0A388L6K1_CHABU|nr:hypothetical protein CBR_g25866 [Chara braunii]|eukprot:GBG77935.1 hypothetical protein CBR_g25866 [Chara braunii]
MRKEAERIRKVEAREARLEAKMVKLVNQHTKHVHSTTAPVIRKKSPRTKAHMLREICSYIDESEDESEEVRREAGRLVDAIERRKGKQKKGEERAMLAARVKTTRTAPIIIEDIPEETHTPPPKDRGAEEGIYGGMLEFVLELHMTMSAQKAPELRKICNEEGIEWTRKDVAVSEIVRCRTKLAFGEASDSAHVSPLSRRGECPWARKWIGMLSGDTEDLRTKEAGVYVLVSPCCRHTYIDCTSRSFILRWTEHVKCAITGSVGNAPKLHAWLRVFGWEKYLVLPMVVGVDEPRIVERALIGRFSQTLNTQGWNEGRRKTRRRKGKRERGKKLAAERQGRVITFGGTASLITLFKRMGRNGEFKSYGGELWAEKWKIVKGKIGNSTLEIHGKERALGECKGEIEKRGTFRVVKIRISSTGVVHRRYVLRDLLRQPWRVRQLHKKSAAELIALFKTASTFGRKVTQNLLKIRITRVVKAVFSTEIRRRPFVRLSFSTAINPRGVRELATKALGQGIRDPCLARYVSARVRVVFRRRYTVGQLIHNQRLCAGAEVVECTCTGTDLPQSDGHVKVRLDDVPEAPNFVKNSRNVTCGGDISDDELRRCVKEGVRTWARGTRMVLDETEVAACFKVRGALEVQAMTVQQVRHWFRGIEHLIAVPIDRNPGATLIVCPVLYLEACEKVFNRSSYFCLVQRTEEAILKAMKSDYEERGLKRIGEWGKGGQVGQAYVIPKDKDLERWQPISPATKDPARLAGLRVGRAVRFMLQGIGESRHFELRCTDDLRVKSVEIEKRLRKEGDFAVARNYDIKDMFARLSHESVIEAVRWIISFHRKRKSVGVRVSQRVRMCMMARNSKKTEGFVFLDFDLLMSAVHYELDNTFVKCAGEFLRQVFGIPMGRNSSPALACLVCARSEAIFLESLGCDRDIIQRMRMIDNVVVMAACEASNGKSVMFAECILDLFERCYDENLWLVRREEGTNVFDFLGTRMMVEPAPIRIHIFPRTRNQEQLARHRRIRIHFMQDYHSYSRKSAKKAAICASLSRIHRLSTDEEATLASISAIVWETNLRGYPRRSLSLL